MSFVDLQTFGWSDGTLVFFNLWGVIMFFIFSPVSAYLLSVSLRYSVLGGTFMVFLGATVRLVTIRIRQIQTSTCSDVFRFGSNLSEAT